MLLCVFCAGLTLPFLCNTSTWLEVIGHESAAPLPTMRRLLWALSLLLANLGEVVWLAKAQDLSSLPACMVRLLPQTHFPSTQISRAANTY